MVVKKIWGLVLLTFILMQSIVPCSAITQEKVTTISLETAYENAILATNQFEKIEKSLYKLTKLYGAKEETRKIDKYDMKTEFNRLYDKMMSGQFLQSYEQGELVMYYAVFKDSEIFENKSLKPVINPDEFPNCDVWLQMMQLKINGENLRKGLIDGVRQLYDNLLYINDSIALSEEYLKVMERELCGVEQKFKTGTVSELDFERSRMNFQIKKMELNKQKRTKENLELNLKKNLGLKLNTVIEIKPYKISQKELYIPSYDISLKNALLNRKEIALPKMNKLAAQTRIPVINHYLTYVPQNEDLQLSLKETVLSIGEFDNEIKTQEGYVRKDIDSTYAKILHNKKGVDIETRKYNESKKNYDKAKIQYQAGQISSTSLDYSRLSCETSRINYEKAVRDLTYEINALNTACGV
ncbi:TolC family protein [Clostridium sp. BNL1100]|uniref:TolC family protein n=1 Tax=Clostridium sp. BNL1100 TaxID=755731 RepID=UPI00024A7FE4|nr:TolC family protein [Clostridium sp. BNL1100]AEY68100.1 hypothetical protein Clo1100_3992 [Clostridium sp. BNL1100]